LLPFSSDFYSNKQKNKALKFIVTNRKSKEEEKEKEERNTSEGKILRENYFISSGEIINEILEEKVHQ